MFKRNQNEPAHVVARLVNREDAENAIRGRYKLRSFPHLKKIFIIDNLCPRYREIFDDLEELKRSGVVKQLWSYNGKIHYKTNHSRRGKGIRVFHADDIKPLKTAARLLSMERKCRDEIERPPPSVKPSAPSFVKPSPPQNNTHAFASLHNDMRTESDEDENGLNSMSDIPELETSIEVDARIDNLPISSPTLQENTNHLVSSVTNNDLSSPVDIPVDTISCEVTESSVCRSSAPVVPTAGNSKSLDLPVAVATDASSSDGHINQCEVNESSMC